MKHWTRSLVPNNFWITLNTFELINSVHIQYGLHTCLLVSLEHLTLSLSFEATSSFCLINVMAVLLNLRLKLIPSQLLSTVSTFFALLCGGVSTQSSLTSFLRLMSLISSSTSVTSTFSLELSGFWNDSSLGDIFDIKWVLAKFIHDQSWGYSWE